MNKRKMPVTGEKNSTNYSNHTTYIYFTHFYFSQKKLKRKNEEFLVSLLNLSGVGFVLEMADH